MSLQIQFFGATREVTGSFHVVRTDSHTVVMECGLIQGNSEDEDRNREPLPVPVDEIDAVILSHAHIDHSGRVPLLYKNGYRGPVFAHSATRALCEIMLPDAGYLNEKDAEYENRKRRGKGKPYVHPLYTLEDAEHCITLFETLDYEEPREIVPGLTLTYYDAGHILGSCIVKLTARHQGVDKDIVFSGDLGFRDSPVMNDAVRLSHADVVLMESTYGDRCHRPFEETMVELTGVFETARARKGNILIPAFTVGRTQDLLYLMADKVRLIGVRGQAADRMHLDTYAVFVTPQLYRIGAVDDPAAQRPMRLIPDDHEVALGAPDVMFEVMSNPAATHHAAAGDNDGA